MASAFFSLVLAGALLAAGTPAILAQAGPHVLVTGAVKTRSFAYGAHPNQTVTLTTRAKAPPAPLIVYIHGGGWTEGSAGAGGGAKPAHFTARGFAYAAIGYRFVPGVRVEDQLADLARALRVIRYDARGLRVDPDRIVLLGHSSGGQLAALLGSDPRYIEAAGVPFAAIKAVVLLDPAGLDIPAIMGAIDPRDPHYGPAFAGDPVRQAALSPVNHGAAPNAPAWAMLYDRNNGFAGAQSMQLAAALRAGGAVRVTVEGIADSSHMALNDQLGVEGDPATVIVDSFLRGAIFR